MVNPVRVGITHGDINGIGYEVILGALADETMLELYTPVIFGHHSIAVKCRQILELDNMKLHRINNPFEAMPGRINIVELQEETPQLTPGIPNETSGKSAALALEEACKALEEGAIDVLVTAPISKESIHSEQFPFPGHTEFLEQRIGHGEKARMILFDENVRVGLVSTHLPVAKISQAVTKEAVLESIRSVAESLTKDFGFERPRIAVLALNPHCGDGGLLGSEEEEVIIPAITEASENDILAFGPFPADGFFGNGDYRHFDGIVAMYHDQGLAPFKTLAGQAGVNFTAGLPYVRTSPDHGTACAIAWRGEADPTSMRQAIFAATDIWRNRKRWNEASANPLKKYIVEKPDRSERMPRAERNERNETKADNHENNLES